MRIDDTRPPNIGNGPEGPGGETPIGSIGRWSGRVTQPGISRLPAEQPSAASPQEPLQDRAPLYATIVESSTLDAPTVAEIESLQEWLAGSDSRIETYVEGVLMSSMLKDLVGGATPP